MDLKQIEKLMSMMEKAKIKRLALKEEGLEIELERECLEPQSLSGPPPSSYGARTFQPEEVKEKPKAQEKAPESGHFVPSPMVGTFYLASSPDDPPFVRLGDTVKEDTVLCIIEAMKVMNEVKSGVKGRVAEILVKNGSPVEFGTKMFKIDVS